MTNEAEAVYREYYPKIVRYIRCRVDNEQDAEDLAQKVFLKFYESQEGFDRTKASVATWVYTIARNTVIDYFRTRHICIELSEIPEPVQEESAFGHIEMQEQLNMLADALKKLPQNERDIIILYYYSGRTLTQIAQNMGKPYGQIKRLHIKALNHLRMYM